MMHAGECNKAQIQGWVANRFHYQISVPIKDANLLANRPDPAVRREWVQRIIDHDGAQDQPADRGGGIDDWLALGEAVGLTRDELWSQRRVLPGVRFAVDAYINFVHRAPWQEAVCSSSTELFSPDIHRQRLSGWPERYPRIAAGGLRYFRRRLSETRRDVDHSLRLTLDYFDTRAAQESALDILQFKLDVLWTMLDAMYLAYVAEMPPYFNVAEPADDGAV